MKFSALGLSEPILKAVSDKGYETPSPIQAQAIPVVLEGHDLMAAAQTGTGKTAGFTLPILELLTHGEPAGKYQIRVLILTPTRELAAQIEDNIKTYSKYMDLSYGVVFGGVNIKPQISKLKKGVDILVATPGRLLDLYNQKAFKTNRLEILVLDEADRMLDMGFIHDIKKVIKILPKKRQNLLFSATFSKEIRTLAKTIINKDPIEISVTPRNTTVEAISHSIIAVDKKQKTKLLIHLILHDRDHDWSQVLVFSRTKHGANKLVQNLIKSNITAAVIHGNKSQAARTKALANFKNGTVEILVATDIAARGIDISQLPLVVNFDLPNTPEDYVHRIGRTGRAGKTGDAISLVCSDESKELASIERLIKQTIPRIELDGFEPSHTLANAPTKQKKSRSKKHTPKPGSEKEKRMLAENANDGVVEGRNREPRRSEPRAYRSEESSFTKGKQTSKHSGKAQNKSKNAFKGRRPSGASGAREESSENSGNDKSKGFHKSGNKKNSGSPRQSNRPPR